MSFLGHKRRSESLRTLTEKEIQDKLYGSYRSSGLAVVHEDREPDRSAAPVATARPPLVIKPSPRIVERIPVAASSTKSAGSFEFGKFFKTAGVSLGAGLRLAFILPFQVFRSLIGQLITFLISLDFRRSGVRTAAYWLGAAAFLGLLFLSIHHLNEKRENAMRSSRPVPHAAAFVPQENQTGTPEAEQTPEQTAVPAPAAVSAEDKEIQPEAAPEPYAIQIATFAAREDAERLAVRLKEESANAFVKTLSRGTNRVYYCVFIGRYKTFPEAQSELERFRKRPSGESFKDAFIRAV